jgi:hypothetical protein
MRVPRFQSRRNVSVASAGYFSVLKTPLRTVPVLPPGGYRVLANPAGAPATSIDTPEQLATRLRTIKIPLIGDTGMIDRGFVRMALILMSAASFIYFILWWIIRGHF